MSWNRGGKPYILWDSDGEEGEVGSPLYKRRMKRNKVAATDAMVNMTLWAWRTEIWATSFRTST